MEKSNISKLLLVDDHTLFRDGLRELISHWQEFQVIGEARNGQEAVAFCQQRLPNIILMDIQMPVLNGVEAAKTIHAKFPSISLVMLTMSVEDKDLFDALKHGARGFILKTISGQQLRERLREVARGEVPLSGTIAAKILAEFNRQKDDELKGEYEPLTKSEIQILQLVAGGLSNAEIGAQLFISEQTAKKHLSIVMQKLHLNNRVQAAVYAVRKGLTE